MLTILCLCTTSAVNKSGPRGRCGTLSLSNINLSNSATLEQLEPLAVLTSARAEISGFASAFRAYWPPVVGDRAGGDLDDPETLPQVLPSAAADGEVMLLCIGGSGSMRTGTNLVLNFRSMGLAHMLIFAPDHKTCTSLWEALPDLACVWWPSKFHARRPRSHYNTQFNPVALAFFEARKVLLEALVLRHGLNVLHLDADSVWFAVRRKISTRNSHIRQNIARSDPAVGRTPIQSSRRSTLAFRSSFSRTTLGSTRAYQRSTRIHAVNAAERLPRTCLMLRFALARTGTHSDYRQSLLRCLARSSTSSEPRVATRVPGCLRSSTGG